MTDRMNVPAVRNIAKGCEAAGAALKVVAAMMEVQMMILRTTAFLGLVGNIALERYLARMQPKIARAATRLTQLSEYAMKEAAQVEKASQAG